MIVAHLDSNHTPEQDRLAHWREFLGRKIFRVDIDPLPEQRFFIDATLCGLPGLTVVSALSSGARSRRNHDLIDGEEHLVLNIVREGTCVVSQRGVDAVCAPGEAILMSSTDPCTVLRPSAAKVTTLSLPLKALTPLVADVKGGLLRAMPANTGALKLLAHYIDTMPGDLLADDPALQKAYVGHVYDLIALAIGATADGMMMARSGGLRAARLQGVKHYINQHAHEPDLTPLSTATAMAMSVRQLHQLFEPTGLSFKRYLTMRRLELCRHMLARPGDRHRNIADIAFHSGFESLATFYRAFKQAYHCLPADCRDEGIPSRGHEHLRETAPK